MPTDYLSLETMYLSIGKIWSHTEGLHLGPEESTKFAFHLTSCADEGSKSIVLKRWSSMGGRTGESISFTGHLTRTSNDKTHCASR